MITSIHLAAEKGAAMEPQKSARLVADAGIVGDRKQNCITLIEEEAVSAAGLEPGQTRRAIAVKGVALNSLVGQRFLLGNVPCEGIELCHPCSYLEGLLERPGLTKELANRGGIRARVLQDGEIRVGDAITLV